MNAIARILKIIDSINAWVGKTVSWAIFGIALIVLYSIISRLLDVATMWNDEVIYYLFGLAFLLGGAYTQLHRAHVKIEIIYERFSPRVRAIVDICTWPLFVLFTGTLLVVGTQMAISAVKIQEKFATPVATPAYLLKIMVPVGALLLLLQGIAELIRNVNRALGKKEIVTEAEPKDIEEREM